jgi:hypothetical protein
MRGEPNTQVMLTIFRKDENRSFPVTIVREEIRTQSVRAKMVEPGYGWVRVSLSNAAGSFMVHDWAYENSGGSIQTGAIPAPGALGILAAGASGLGLLRGRKRSK